MTRDHDVYFYEAFEEESRGLAAILPARWRAGYTSATIQESGDTAPPAPLISIRTQSRPPAGWLTSVKGLHARSTGYDHLIELVRLNRAPPAMGALPKYCGRAVAEQAILMMLALLRKLSVQARSFDRFSRDGLTGREAAGRRLAVFGVGDIGHHIIRIARGLDMETVGVDIVQRHADIAYAEPEAALSSADVTVSAMNLTPDNRGYFTRKLLMTSRPGAIFINVGRGEASPAAVLLELLESGHLSGVGLDVYNEEDAVAAALRGNSDAGGGEIAALRRLRQRPDVLLTPHNAFNTQEALARKCELTIAQVDSFLSTGRFQWPLATP